MTITALPCKERSRVLIGETTCLDVDGANLYVTVNHKEEEILEVFVNGPV